MYSHTSRSSLKWLQGNNMFCRNCGKELKEDAKFCPYCGVLLHEDETKKTETAESPAPFVASALGAGLLGIFLGCYGVHNFYLKYTSKAIVQLVLGLLVVTWPVSAIWGLIEGIRILTGSIKVDGTGQPIKRDV